MPIKYWWCRCKGCEHMVEIDGRKDTHEIYNPHGERFICGPVEKLICHDDVVDIEDWGETLACSMQAVWSDSSGCETPAGFLREVLAALDELIDKKDVLDSLLELLEKAEPSHRNFKARKGKKKC